MLSSLQAGHLHKLWGMRPGNALSHPPRSHPTAAPIVSQYHGTKYSKQTGGIDAPPGSLLFQNHPNGHVASGLYCDGSSLRPRGLSAVWELTHPFDPQLRASPISSSPYSRPSGHFHTYQHAFPTLDQLGGRPTHPSRNPGGHLLSVLPLATRLTQSQANSRFFHQTSP